MDDKIMSEQLREQLRELYSEIWKRFHVDEERAIELMTDPLKSIMIKTRAKLNNRFFTEKNFNKLPDYLKPITTNQDNSNNA